LNHGIYEPFGEFQKEEEKKKRERRRPSINLQFMLDAQA